MNEIVGPNCPAPSTGDTDRITLAHGEGGRLMRRLIRERIVAKLGNEILDGLGDAALLPKCNSAIAITTDTFVVSPIFFPGGDIGSLAVYGTVNDLAVSGARPRWISIAMIIEEGLPLATLDQVIASIADAARRVGVLVVTGDTKVVPRGAADGLFLNTTGVGQIVDPRPPGPGKLEVGDALIVSGPIGRHGMAVMSAREGLEFDPPPASDSAPLADAVEALLDADIPIRAMRDATRGGLTAVLHEWAESSNMTMSVDEQAVPVTADVRGACEVLGLDPFHVANEGTMVVGVPRHWAAATVDVLRKVPATSGAVQVGEVCERAVSPVVVRRSLGNLMPLDEPLGAPLPRIC